MASISGYPHVEMHVRDDSIYIPSTEEILPLNKPLYMMKAARGPVGVPVWCATYSDAVKVFGADTFNKRSKYFSENAYYLLKTFPFNGAFIMRVASEDATDAHVSIEIGLNKSSLDALVAKTALPSIVPQFKRDVNGNFELELTGAKIPVNSEGKTEEECEEAGVAFEQAYLPGYKLAWRATIRPNSGDTRPLGSESTANTDNFTWFPLVDIEASNPGAWGSCYGIKLYFDPSANTLSGTITNGAVTMSLTPVELLQDATVATSVIDAYGASCVTGVIKPDVVDADTEVDLTLSKRVKKAYSGNYALPLTFTYLENNWNIVGCYLMNAEIAVREAAYSIYKNAGLEKVIIDVIPAPAPFAVTTDTTRDPAKADGDYFIKTGPGMTEADFTACTAANFNADGSFIASEVYYERQYDTVVYGCKTFVDDLFSKVATASDIGPVSDGNGYMTNIASCTSYNGVPFFASCVIDATDTLLTSDTRVAPNLKDIVVPTSDQAIFLGGGVDGPIDDWNIEEYIRAQIHLAVSQSHEYLNDYWRCPFNCVYDTGYTIKTKKALIDFQSARDDVVSVISSQITWKKSETDILDPVANSRMDDESIAASLRAYALLFKEDVENATMACRTIIFTACGKTSDHDDKWVPVTLWYALKNAEYLNKPYIDQEPKELPYSAVECFTEVSWTAAQEDTKSRVWNLGVNYMQYYDMTGIHFASVRSVYWYETSILVDAGVVNALVFMKFITRRSWSTWAGSTRIASELNQKITEDLNSRLNYMLHGKFRHKVNVYQTTEDKNLGYQRHVDLELWAAGQNRVWKATIICKREGFNQEAE